jgi:hypothetical protein
VPKLFSIRASRCSGVPVPNTAPSTSVLTSTVRLLSAGKGCVDVPNASP